MTLFERTKEISKKRGMNLQEVAKEAGLGINAIYKWQKSAPTIEKIEAVAKVLGVSVDELLGKPSSNINHDLEVEEAINSMRSYQGKPITESQREVLRGIIKGYLDSKDK